MRADWDDDLSILSSENVSFAVETAGLGTRFAAVLIDMTLQLLVMALIAFAAMSLVMRIPTSSDWNRILASFGSALVAIVVFLVTYAYFFFFEWLMDGQTPGKRWLHLRVLQTTAMPITMWAALVRNLLRIVDFLPAFYGIGAFVAVLNPHNRRVGDLVAGTVVARERPHGARRLVLDIDEAAAAFLSAGRAPEPASALPSSGPMLAANGSVATSPVMPSPILPAMPASQGNTQIDVQAANLRVRLDDQDYELIREFLLRRDKMQAAARERLAHSLAVRISQKLGEPLPPSAILESYLENIAALLQDSQQIITR